MSGAYEQPPGTPVEAEIEYWGEFQDAPDGAFWTKRAMEAAVSRWWYSQRETTEPLADVTLRVDRTRGVVILTEIPAVTSAKATGPVEDSDDQNTREHTEATRARLDEPQYGFIGRPDRPGGV